MISSIVVTGCHNIGVNSANKIQAGDNILSIDKEIPFVRYRFNQYTETEVAYIKATKQKFARSTHLVELNIENENPQNVLGYLASVSEIESISKYLYISISNTEVAEGRVSDVIVNTVVSAISQYPVDRIMLKDKSTTLDMVATKKIIKQLTTATKLSEDTFGVCSSPLSFGDLACLTAVKARELMGRYSAVADVALPTANHQCMNCCGCIRYIVIDSDTAAPVETASKQKTTKAKAENSEETKKVNTSKPKVFLQPGRFSL